jgi:hypothetical protein
MEYNDATSDLDIELPVNGFHGMARYRNELPENFL